MEVEIEEAQLTLSPLLRRVARGEPVMICRDGVPVAELVRSKSSLGERQIWGNVSGSIGPDFDLPLEGFDG